jgi:hypothetical protein
MKVTKVCILNGKTYTREIPKLTPELLERIESRGGELIQNVAPNLSPADREFLITGTPPNVWDEIFGEE